jgi:hypothetical protein
MKFRHKKRGSTYTVIGEAAVQSDTHIVEGDTLVIYQAEDGRIWARPKVEFHDGRFEEIKEST